MYWIKYFGSFKTTSKWWTFSTYIPDTFIRLLVVMLIMGTASFKLELSLMRYCGYVNWVLMYLPESNAFHYRLIFHAVPYILETILVFIHDRPTFSKDYEVQGWVWSCMSPRILRPINNGHESCGTWNPKMTVLARPEAIYLIDQGKGLLTSTQKTSHSQLTGKLSHGF
jgi:hypothetical protein